MYLEPVRVSAKQRERRVVHHGGRRDEEVIWEILQHDEPPISRAVKGLSMIHQ